MFKFVVLLVVGGLLYRLLMPFWTRASGRGDAGTDEQQKRFDKREAVDAEFQDIE